MYAIAKSFHVIILRKVSIIIKHILLVFISFLICIKEVERKVKRSEDVCNILDFVLFDDIGYWKWSCNLTFLADVDLLALDEVMYHR